MMRILESGYNVHLVEIKKETYPVDTLSDLKAVTKIKLRYDPVELDYELIVPMAKDDP